jgi:hypothetical protein
LFTHLYCGLTIESNISLPELPQANQDKSALVFSLKSSQPQSTEFLWSDFWVSKQGKKVLLYFGDSSFHLLRIPGLADFRISTSVNEICCYPLAETPLTTIRHLLLDSILPRCLAHQGKLMVHASAVQLEQGILLFIGDTGTGKSTLAGDFYRAGYPTISDDVVWLKENQEQLVQAVASYNGLRLWDDSLMFLFSPKQNIETMAHYSSKKRIDFDKGDLVGQYQGGPILGVVILAPPSQDFHQDISLEPISLRDAFMEIIYESFQLNRYDLKERTTRMQTVGRIVPQLRFFRLSMLRNYSLLPTVRQKILEKLILM